LADACITILRQPISEQNWIRRYVNNKIEPVAEYVLTRYRSFKGKQQGVIAKPAEYRYIPNFEILGLP